MNPLDNTLDPAELEGRFQALVAQRNNALNESVMLAGLLTLRDREIARLEDALKAATAPVDPGTDGNPK